MFNQILQMAIIVNIYLRIDLPLESKRRKKFKINIIANNVIIPIKIDSLLEFNQQF